MASISKVKTKNGFIYRIQFKTCGKRGQVSLGSKYSARQIDEIKHHVEELAERIETGGKLARSTVGFLEDMTDDLKKRFEAAGLLEESKTITNKELFDLFLKDYASGKKDSTILTYEGVSKRFLAKFSENGNPADLTKNDGLEWKKYLRERGYAEATITGCFQRMATVLNWAVEKEYIESNPFRGIPRGSFTNPDRMFFVPMSWYEKLLDACPDQTWRTLLALCRIGGLRNPSETLLLTWSDIDWDKGSVLVHSPKTEHHSGKGTRIIPMFPELRVELERQFELAEEGGSPYIIDRWRGTSLNMRTHFERIIFRAGLPTWNRLFQNLRESRANEILREYGPTAESSWLGHSQRIAADHYFQVMDTEFQKAVRGNSGAGTPKETDTADYSDCLDVYGNKKDCRNYCR